MNKTQTRHLSQPFRAWSDLDATLSTVHGLQDNIDPDRLPKNFKDVMSCPDSQEWAEAYQKEFQGCKDRNVLDVVKPSPGMKVLGTTMITKYKVNNGVIITVMEK